MLRVGILVEAHRVVEQGEEQNGGRVAVLDQRRKVETGICDCAPVTLAMMVGVSARRHREHLFPDMSEIRGFQGRLSIGFPTVAFVSK